MKIENAKVVKQLYADMPVNFESTVAEEAEYLPWEPVGEDVYIHAGWVQDAEQQYLAENLPIPEIIVNLTDAFNKHPDVESIVLQSK